MDENIIKEENTLLLIAFNIDMKQDEIFISWKKLLEFIVSKLQYCKKEIWYISIKAIDTFEILCHKFATYHVQW